MVYITSGSGGGPLTCVMPKTLVFSIFSSLASLAINFKHIVDRNMAKTSSKITFTSTFYYLSMILIYRSLPPLRSNPGSATVYLRWVISKHRKCVAK